MVHRLDSRRLGIGRFLFKHRSFTPLPLIVLITVLFRPVDAGEYNAILNVGGLVLALLGETIRIIAVGYARAGTSGRESYLRADALNTSGIYSLVRNPLYIGNLLIYTGLLAVFANPLALLLFDACLLFQYYFIIHSEEHYLKTTHGPPYESYCREVSRLLPRFRHYRKPTLPFDPQKVLYKENDSLFNLLLIYLLVLAYKERLLYGHLHNLPLFITTAALLTTAYITIKILKKSRSRQQRQEPPGK